MNERRFVELLNLYIDKEASPEERDEVEMEVKKNPRRREKFLSYCRLQEASEQVHRDFGHALALTVDLNKYQIVARSSTRCCWRRGLLYSSGALVAACLTVVAAVSILQDSQPQASLSHSQKNSFGLVEVIDSHFLNGRRESVRTVAFGGAEPFTFAGRPEILGRSQARTIFWDSGQTGFRVQESTGGWSDAYASDPKARGFRGHSSFDHSPELTSFRFQR
jgi:hypothetical protein